MTLHFPSNNSRNTPLKPFNLSFVTSYLLLLSGKWQYLTILSTIETKSVFGSLDGLLLMHIADVQKIWISNSGPAIFDIVLQPIHHHCNV